MLFSLSCVALALGYLIAQAVVRSKAGKVLIAIRDAESRTRFLGYRVENYKTYVFTLSACMAGVAGALYVPQVGIINPSEFAPANSIEMVIWVAVGGRGTLIGGGARRGHRQLPQDHLHHRRAGALLAVPAGRHLRAGDHLPAARRAGAAAEARAAPRRQRRPGERRRRCRATGGVTSHGHYRRSRQAARDHPQPALSQRRKRELRRLPRPQQPLPRHRPRRDARHHRPERRRQDHHDGRHHRQDPARHRRGAVRQRQHRSHRQRRGRHRPARHRPQVPEADRVREPHGGGQRPPRARRATARVRRNLFWRPTATSTASAISSRPSGSPRIASGWLARSRTARSSGSRSAC